jgi:CBS domain-containing protein
MTISSLLAGRDQAIITCHPDQTVSDAAQLLAEKRIGALPVIDGGEVVGIFSERDLLYCIAKVGAEALGKPIREVMTSPAITISPKEKALDTLALMTRRRIRHLPVVDNGKLVAFVSIGDIVKYRIEKVEAEASQLRDYIQLA